eukprot:scaffold44064_cov70-Phaeocystis_antarctica.AAC.8
MSAVTPRLLCKSTLAPRLSSSLTSSRWPYIAAACSRAKAAVLPSRPCTGSPSWADLSISTGSEAGEYSAGSPASGGAAGPTAAGCDGAACCRMSSTMAVSVSALARSRACTHASCPWLAAIIRAVPPRELCKSGLAECCSRRCRMERWPRYAAFMSAVKLYSSSRSTLAPRSSSSVTISRWPLAAAACSRVAVAVWLLSTGTAVCASASPPSCSHSTTFCSSPFSADSNISIGSEAAELTAGSTAPSGSTSEAAAGCSGAACCRISSTVAGGAAVAVEQLDVGPGSQQGLHARLLPLVSRLHQGGDAAVGLQVEVGRVLQEEEQGREVTAKCSNHERGEAETGWQVDARASLQQLLHQLQLTGTRGSVQQGESRGPTVDTWSRAERLASLGRLEHLDGQRGGRAHRGLASVWGGGMRGGTSLRVRWGVRRSEGRLRRRCVQSDELRGGRLALDLGPLRCGAAVHVDQLGVGLASGGPARERAAARALPGAADGASSDGFAESQPADAQ